jgi:hypothetical protein
MPAHRGRRERIAHLSTDGVGAARGPKRRDHVNSVGRYRRDGRVKVRRSSHPGSGDLEVPMSL